MRQHEQCTPLHKPKEVGPESCNLYPFHCTVDISHCLDVVTKKHWWLASMRHITSRMCSGCHPLLQQPHPLVPACRCLLSMSASCVRVPMMCSCVGSIVVAEWSLVVIHRSCHQEHGSNTSCTLVGARNHTCRAPASGNQL